jgi:hypothetical protein
MSDLLRPALKNQYHAALAMLREAVQRCPDELWYSEVPLNAFWQVAYHTLFFAHLYLEDTDASFRPWAQHQRAVQHPDGIPGPPDPTSALPLIPTPYSRDQVLAYWSECDAMVDRAVDAMDLQRQESGFSWYPISKLEHQFVNIRHIQHHVAQLADRLRTSQNIGIDWVGTHKSSTAARSPAP